MRDLLTGLPTFRDLDAIVADGEPSGLLVDIDSLLWLNDQFGHEVGDQALVAVSVELTRIFGTTGTTRTTGIFRIAGDTFLVVLPAVDVDPVDAALRVVEAIRALNIPYRRLDRPDRTRLEVNVVVVRLTAQRLSQCFTTTDIAGSDAVLWAELVYREKLRNGGPPGVVVDAR